MYFHEKDRYSNFVKISFRLGQEPFRRDNVRYLSVHPKLPE